MEDEKKPPVEATAELPVEKPAEEKPQGPTEIVLRNHNGTFRTQRRGDGGKFVKGQPKMIPTQQVTAMLRKWAHIKYSPTGKLTKESKSRYEEMVESLRKIVMGESDMDPKSQMAAVSAFTALDLRLHGKHSVSDEDREALKTHGIKVVIVQTPTSVPEVQDRPKAPTKPSWLEGEIIEGDPDPEDSEE